MRWITIFNLVQTGFYVETGKPQHFILEDTPLASMRKGRYTLPELCRGVMRYVSEELLSRGSPVTFTATNDELNECKTVSDFTTYLYEQIVPSDTTEDVTSRGL